MKLILPLTVSAAAVSANVGLLVPLYEYPTGDAAVADWTALTQAIEAHPDLEFYVIINDNNGAPYSTNPPDTIKDWASWLGTLNARSNVKTVGYVYTSESSRDYATVTQGVDQYAAWTTNPGWSGGATNYDVHIDGIFFDEIDTNPAKLDYNTNITKYAKAAFQSEGPIVLNPGVSVQAGSESLYDVADAILAIETCYTTVQGATDAGSSTYRCPSGGYTPFTPASLSALPDNQTRVARSSVVVHDFYDAWNPYDAAPLSTLEADVSAIVQKQVHSFYIAQYGYLGNFTSAPASVMTVANLAAQDQGLTRRRS